MEGMAKEDYTRRSVRTLTSLATHLALANAGMRRFVSLALARTQGSDREVTGARMIAASAAATVTGMQWQPGSNF